MPKFGAFPNVGCCTTPGCRGAVCTGGLPTMGRPVRKVGFGRGAAGAGAGRGDGWRGAGARGGPGWRCVAGGTFGAGFGLPICGGLLGCPTPFGGVVPLRGVWARQSVAMPSRPKIAVATRYFMAKSSNAGIDSSSQPYVRGPTRSVSTIIDYFTRSWNPLPSLGCILDSRLRMAAPDGTAKLLEPPACLGVAKPLPTFHQLAPQRQSMRSRHCVMSASTC